jgi:hypothetical protein
MARRTATEIYQLARSAGLSVPQAVIAVAIGLAESSGDDTAIGDLGLQTDVWGPSVGIWQIRTLKAETGTGSNRDINALKGKPERQAQAMLAISRQGSDWSPWTVYNKGIYQNFLGQAQDAAKASGAMFEPIAYTPEIPGADAVLGGVKTLLMQSAGVMLGLVLLSGGLVLAMSPTTRRVAGTVVKTAKGAVGL